MTLALITKAGMLFFVIAKVKKSIVAGIDQSKQPISENEHNEHLTVFASSMRGKQITIKLRGQVFPPSASINPCQTPECASHI
jgi:hypothetical protein